MEDLERNCLPRSYGPAKRPEGCEFRQATPQAVALTTAGLVRVRILVGHDRWFWLDMTPAQSKALREQMARAEGDVTK